MLHRRVMPKLADAIRYSETFDVPALDLIETIRTRGFEGSGRQAARKCVPGRRALGRLAEAASEPRTAIRDRGYIPGANDLDSVLIGYLPKSRRSATQLGRLVSEIS